MRNIWTIFTRDIRKIRTNVIALIVVLGVTVVPCLYAWYNIAASWDPYGNTGNLKVAVASVDEGYIGNLIPLQLNLGDQVLSALRRRKDSRTRKGIRQKKHWRSAARSWREGRTRKAGGETEEDCEESENNKTLGTDGKGGWCCVGCGSLRVWS